MTPSVVAERVPPRAHTRLKEARSWRLSGKDLPSQPGRATGRGVVDKPLRAQQPTRDLAVEFVQMERVEVEYVLSLHLDQPSQLLDCDRRVRVGGAIEACEQVRPTG